MNALEIRTRAAALVRDHAARLGMDRLAAATLAAAIDAIPAPAVDPWRPLDDAARRDIAWLLVDYSGEQGEHPIADATFAATIGFWQDGDGSEGEWKFAGWCWSHDHFTEGRGRVVAWKPIGFMIEHTGDWPLPEDANPPAGCIEKAL